MAIFSNSYICTSDKNATEKPSIERISSYNLLKIDGVLVFETDEVEEDYVEKSETEFIVDGDMNIYDMFELVGFDDDEFESKLRNLWNN